MTTASPTKPKLNLQIMFDRILRRKVFLDPQPDGSFKAITINGLENGYYKDEKGATLIHPSRIREVSGLKYVRYIAVKEYGFPGLADMFQNHTPVECATCHNTIWTPEGQMTEKMFADVIDIAETAGRYQAERDANPASGNKMNMILIGMAGIGVLVLWLIMSQGAA